MATCFHSKQNILDGDGVHAPISYIYANATVRNSATGFVQSDGYKLAIDLDTNLVFILIDWSTPTWSSFGGGGGSDTDAIHNNISSEISSITLKGSPISGDLLLIEDSGDSNNKKRITIGTLPFLGATASAGGDLTGTYPNPTVSSGAITFAKMQDISTDRLIGRDSSGSGVATEIALASTLVWTGSNSIGRATISGDITVTAGSNTAAITAGAIVNADINASAAIAVSKLAAGSNGQVLTTTGGSPTWETASSASYRESYDAFRLISPNNSDWAVNAFASWATDSVDPSLLVRRFDDTVVEGVGFGMTIPTGVTNISLYFKSRGQAAGGGTATVSLYSKTMGDNVTPGAWSSPYALTDLTMPTNTNWQYDSQTIALSTLSLTAGNYVQFEFVRTGGSLSGDLVLLELVVEFT